MENKLHLTIDGMHCGACVRRVTNALTGLDGVQVDQVDVGSAQVNYDGQKVSKEEIVAAVDRIGFAAKVSN